MTLENFTFSELRSIVNARNSGQRILPGERYLRSAVVNGYGDFFDFKARPEIHQICLKYNLYEE